MITALSTSEDPRAIRSRKALREGLLRLLEQRAFESITAREIAAAAGIGYSTFFRQYGSKDALLDAIAAQELHTLLQLTRPSMDAEDGLSSCLTLCRYVDANRSLWTILLGGGAAAAIRREYLQMSRNLAKSHPAPQAWLTAELGVRTAVSTILEILTWWLEQDTPVKPDWVANAMERLALKPIKPGV